MQTRACRFVPLILLAACGGSLSAVPDGSLASTDAAAYDAAMLSPWRLPAGWRSEVIPFPFAFAPGVVHTGVEELRFPPGVFNLGWTKYWSYAY